MPAPAMPASALPAPAIIAATVATPAGPLSLLSHADTLVGAGFTADPGDLHRRLHRSLRPLPLLPGDLAWAVKPVRDYFDGDLTALDALPVHQPSTPGRERLWAQLRAVPAGTTITYTQLARLAGNPRAARAAGAACAANLVAPMIPCHRAVRSGGGLCGYYYGLDRKAWLLHHEGALPGPGRPAG